MSNGYITINGAGIDLSAESSFTVNGITESINEAINANKPIIIDGIVDDDADVSPLAVSVIFTDKAIKLYGATFIITIGDLDTVTVEKVVNYTPPTKTTKSSN